ncbi:MAG TPA: hypothetical protein VF450_23055 [Noviherbaspirillum sp.]
MSGMEISYRIDCDNRLIEVGGGWDAFALENETPAVLRDAVLGRSLLDFVAGTETRHLHEVLLDRARSGIPLQRMPFRCDSPGLRRSMEMDIVSPDGAAVEFHCRLLRVEPRASLLTVTAEPGNGSTMRMCSWCKKVHLTRDLWVEVEEAVARFGLLEDDAPPQVTHGICNSCLEKLYGEGK